MAHDNGTNVQRRSFGSLCAWECLLAAVVLFLFLVIGDAYAAAGGAASEEDQGPFDSVEHCLTVTAGMSDEATQLVGLTASSAGQGDKLQAVRTLCERVIDVWQKPFVASEKTCRRDDRCPGQQASKLRYLRVDLGQNAGSGGDGAAKQSRGHLPARALVALLNTDNLLPATVNGGLVIHGAEIPEPLVLEYIRVATPVMLSDTRIRAGPVYQDFIGRKPLGNQKFWEEGPGAVSLLIEGATFDESLIIANGTRLEGRIQIFKSQFKEFSIRRSHIEGEIEIWRTRADVFGIYEAEINNGTYIVDNEFLGIQIRDAVFGQNPVFNSNMVEGRFWIGYTAFNGDTKKVTVYNNKVLGPFTFVGNSASRGVDGLTFGYNRFAMRSEIEVPHLDVKINEDPKQTAGYGIWHGDVDLTGVESESELRVRPPFGFSPIKESTRCSPDSTAARRFRSDDSTVLFNFTAAQVRVINWKQAKDCSMRWHGRGFRYALFDPEPRDAYNDPENSSGSDRNRRGPLDPRERMRHVEEWADALWHAEDEAEQPTGELVDPLTFLAGYLREQGYHAASRDKLQEAKHADYQAWAFGSISKQTLAAVLWFGGYGAKPERALFSLLVLWLVGAIIYAAYSSLYQRRYGWGETAGKPSSSSFWYADFEPKDMSNYPGFLSVDKDLRPTRVLALQYSLDAIVPIFNLHAYNRFYPANNVVRYIALFQHVFGIVLWGVLITTWAIL